MSIVFRLIGWIVGLTFFLMGVGLLTVSTEVGLSISAIGILYLPSVRDAVYEITLEELEAGPRFGIAVGIIVGLFYFVFREIEKAELIASETGKPVEQVTVDPWLDPGLVSLGLITAVIAFSVWGGWKRREGEEGYLWEQSKVSDLLEDLERLLSEDYVILACSRCHEGEFKFLSLSTGGRTAQIECRSCGKRVWARNRNESPVESNDRMMEIASELDSFNHHGFEMIELCANRVGQKRKLKREHISQAVRQEVYERDGGECVECGSNEQLEYDHILPHSKGGSSRVNNLQLLCKTCNLQKGAKI